MLLREIGHAPDVERRVWRDVLSDVGVVTRSADHERLHGEHALFPAKRRGRVVDHLHLRWHA